MREEITTFPVACDERELMPILRHAGDDVIHESSDAALLGDRHLTARRLRGLNLREAQRHRCRQLRRPCAHVLQLGFECTPELAPLRRCDFFRGRNGARRQHLCSLPYQ